MPELVLPTPSVRESFIVAMGEFGGEGRGGADDDTMIAREMRQHGARWATEAGFSEYVSSLLADADDDTVRPAHLVPSTTYWWVDGTEYLGRLAIRHHLNPRLLEIGGHIGYDVRPSARRRGHATAMLRAALPRAHELGIDPVLITCDVDNVASRKVIEANGGQFEDERSGKLRYWVPTGSA
jgi:predicted acetyltransferase